MDNVNEAALKAFLEPGVPERNMACLDCGYAWWPYSEGEFCPGCEVSGLEFFVVINPDLKSYSAYSEPYGVSVNARTEDDVIALFFDAVEEKESQG